MRRNTRAALAAATLAAVPTLSWAQAVVYQSNLTSSTGWSTYQSASGANPTNSDATFGFDYSSLGIPQAPGSSNTLALRLRANTNSAAPAVQGVTVVPTGLSLSGNYKIQATVWQNTIGPFPGGGTGSTQFFGFGSGYSGTSAVWRGGSNVGGAGGGTWFAGANEGGFSAGSTTVRDFTAFTGPGNVNANYVTAATAYAASGGDGTSTTAQDNFNAYYASISTGIDVGQVNNGALATAQNAVATPNPNAPNGAQTGTLNTGTTGFAWRTWTIERTGNTVTWSIDGTLISTLTSTDAAPLPLNGGTELTYFDATSGVTSDPLLNFALVSNYVVTIPEPGTGALAVGAVGLLVRRRRDGRSAVG